MLPARRSVVYSLPAQARIGVALTASIAGLLVLHLIGLYFEFALGRPRVAGFGPLVDLDEESNLPTFFTSVLALFAAALLAIVAYANRGGHEARGWWSLAAVLGWISFDEAARIHEMTSGILNELVPSGGLFRYASSGAYLAIVGLLGLAFLGLLHRLPRRTARAFVFAGTIYIVGALGVELIGIALTDAGRYGQPPYVIAATVEEILEMTGLAVFVYALTVYMRVHVAEFRLEFQNRVEAAGRQSDPSGST